MNVSNAIADTITKPPNACSVTIAIVSIAPGIMS